MTSGNADDRSTLASTLGGGMFTEGGSPTIRNCTFAGNSASALGGGMCNKRSSARLTNCTFSGNACPTGNGGGMVDDMSRSTLIGCTFDGNTAIGAAGAYSTRGGNTSFIDCRFVRNTSATVAGGVAVNGAMLVNSNFRGNHGGFFAGGMAAEVATTLINCAFSGNSAERNAAIDHGQGTLVMRGCTLSNNEATSEAGGLGVGATALSIENCIFWRNRDQNGTGQSSQIRTIESSLTVNYSCIEGLTGSLGGVGNIGDDPRFADADGRDDVAGTDDDDLRLAAGSPCIDAGDNEAVPPDSADLDSDGDTDEPIPLDLAGSLRFLDDPLTSDTGNGAPPIVDMGALEFHVVDCNGNGKPDEADIAGGASMDCNGDGVPDECQEPMCIADSDPPDGAIDGRQPFSSGGGPAGWAALVIYFDTDTVHLHVEDFSIRSDPPGPTPGIVDVTPEGRRVNVLLNGPIRPGAWTVISHRASRTSTRVGFLPGEVDGDGTTGPRDILRLVDALNGVGPPLPDSSTDIDRSGAPNSADILREVDLLATWLNATLPAVPD